MALFEALHATTSPSRSRSTRRWSSPRSTAAPTRPGSSTGSSARRWRSEAPSTDGAALEGVEGLLLDLSGVIYVQDEAVPGAAEALERLRSEGIPIRLVTNTTMRPRRSILERLERLGIEADPAELITPATLARRRCGEAGYESVALVVLDELLEDLEGLEERGDSVDAVIVGDLGEALGLRGPQPRLPAADGRRRADRAAEEPLLGDGGRALTRCGPIRRRTGVRHRSRGRGDGEALARVLRAGARRAGCLRRPRRDGRRRRRGGRRRRDGGRPRGGPGPHGQVPRGPGAGLGDRAHRDGRLDRRRARAALAGS